MVTENDVWMDGSSGPCQTLHLANQSGREGENRDGVGRRFAQKSRPVRIRRIRDARPADAYGKSVKYGPDIRNNNIWDVSGATADKIVGELRR